MLLLSVFTDGSSDRGTLEWANDPSAGDTAIPWTGYTIFVDDRCAEDFRPLDLSLLPNPLLPDGAYGMPSVIDYDDDDFSEEEEDRPVAWVVDSGTTFHILSEEEVVARGYTKVPLPSPMTLNTANGQTLATHMAVTHGPTTRPMPF